MDRRKFLQTTGGIATLGIAGVGNARASSGTLTNAIVTGSGAIVATDDDFVIAGQDLTVDGSRGSPIIASSGYSGDIYDNTLTITDIDGTTTGINVAGGDVDVYNNEVDAVDDINDQFLAIRFTDGASGKARRNTISGRHRVGILADGDGTEIGISGNTILGIGPADEGWAENGIQVSSGATANVKRNTITDHWWNYNDFVSSGIIVFGSDDVTIHRNTVTNNDLNMALFGENNNAIHNTIDVNIVPTVPNNDREEGTGGSQGDEVLHYGVMVSGDNNGVRQTSISAEDGDVGIYISSGSDRTKLIRNDIDGWDEAIVDQGDDTKLPKPFEP